MPAAVALRVNWDAKRVRAATREVEDADQARRLLAIAAAYEGQDWSTAAKIGAMDRQTGRFHLRRRQPRDIAHLLWGTGSDTASSFTRQRRRTTIILVGPDSLCAQMAATNGLGGAE